MTIKEIAKMAGVSASTVSKIINGKDEGISRQTHKRVMDLVKTYNYIPYASVLKSDITSLLVGICVQSDPEKMELVIGASNELKQNGYTPLIYYYRDEADERAQLALLSGKPLDGMIWEPYSPKSAEDVAESVRALRIPFCCYDTAKSPSQENISFDYKQIAFELTAKLIESKHEKIACAVDPYNPSYLRFTEGYEKRLQQNNLSEKGVFLFGVDALDDIVLNEFTAVVCLNMEISAQIYRIADKYKYIIPKHLSVATVADETCAALLNPAVSAVSLPFRALGEAMAKQLIAKMEKRDNEPIQKWQYAYHGESIDVPITVRGRKILIVGSLNMDTFVTIDSIPKFGETYAVKNYEQIPGGKGLNQAIGASKLGAEVYVLGAIGQDYEGKVISHVLRNENISMEGIRIDDSNPTGRAYIYVEPNGESGILVYAGANEELTAQYVEDQAHLFDHSSYCLLQTETRLEPVVRALEIAESKGVKTIVKPAAVNELSDDLLKKIDILVPNRKELARITKPFSSVEDMASDLLERGADKVIVTLDKDGVYYRDRAGLTFRYDAADFKPVDTTGAADAFIAALAVFLTEGYDIETSVKYANYAAGYSTTKRGVPYSLIDKATFSQIVETINMERYF